MKRLIGVVDVETTGLFPNGNDRVLEVAAVVTRLDGVIEREYCSLINPGRDVGPRSIHGISSADIVGAPTFKEAAGGLIDALQGCVAIAGHNVRFDRSFLASEFSRLGVSFPDAHYLCTMNLSGGGRLVDCCEERGIPFTGSAHSALDDARAAGRLLTHLLAHDRARTREVEALEPISWPNLRGRGKPPLSRAESKARRERSPTFLQALMSRLRGARTPGSPESDVVADQDLLNCALEDRLIDVATSTALAGVAAERGLAGKTVCFTGEMQQHYRGMPISRDRAQELARSAGLLVADSVTKKLDILVVADALTQSGKAQKARTYGTRILHERMFWRAIGVEVN